jgi:hypothetical protein
MNHPMWRLATCLHAHSGPPLLVEEGAGGEVTGPSHYANWLAT